MTKILFICLGNICRSPMAAFVMKELVEEEGNILEYRGGLPSETLLVSAKKDGFSDRYLSMLLEIPEDQIRQRRISLGITEAWEGVHVSGTENSSY